MKVFRYMATTKAIFKMLAMKNGKSWNMGMPIAVIGKTFTMFASVVFESDQLW